MAVVDYFLKIDGIQGESQDSKHKDEIQLTSWSFGASQQGSFSSLGGGGAGKVQMTDFSFVMPTQKASPKLLLACASGQHIASATLTCRKAGKDPQEYLKYVFSDLLVSSFNTQGTADSTSVLPQDQVTINFTKIEQHYREQASDGTLKGAVSTHYDLKKSTGG
jgi:type VI secretion system secreted protein Hcp